MAQHFTPREEGALAWQGDTAWDANPYKVGSSDYREWHAGWDAEQDAYDDAAFMAEFGEPMGRTGGWIGSQEQMDERRAMGLTALD